MIPSRVLKDLDEIIQNETPVIKEEASLFLCVHLWKRLNSLEKFINVLTNKHDLLASVKSLNEVRQAISVSKCILFK